jgi:hypothetical protein
VITSIIDFTSCPPATQPDLITEHLAQAQLLERDGLREAAQDQYRTILSWLWTLLIQDPDNPALYEQLAAVQAALGDATDAQLSRRIAAYLTRGHERPLLDHDKRH